MRLPLGLQVGVLAFLHPSRGQVEETCAAEGEGFQCVDQAEAGKLNCTASTSLQINVDEETRLSVRPPPQKQCSGSLGSNQTFCCSPPRHDCWNNGCSRKYKGFACVLGQQAATWPKVCISNAQNHLCGSFPTSKCSCCAPKYVECQDFGCSRKGKGYECKNEKEAKEHPVACYRSDRLCKKNCFIPNTGSKPFSPYNAGLTPTPEACQQICQMDPLCQWFNWVPASSSPSGCWLLQYPKTGEISATFTIGWVTGPKYCSPCFCCPPEQPEKCQPTGCEKEFDGLGKCIDVKTANWDELDANFDLSAGSRDNNTCKKTGTDEKDCCRCLKRKPCLDAGCKDEFKGHGKCVDLSTASIAHMKKTLDLSAGEIKGKCRNVLKDDCCSCFKKITPDCKNRLCEAKDGKCVIEGDRPPPNHEKSFPCNETLKCNCWVPIKPCHDDRCTKEMKGKCVGPRHKPPLGYAKSGYNCSNDERCPCWVPIACHDDRCTKQMKGECVSPGHIPPPGYVKIDYNCNNNVKCPCYVKPCEDEKCTDMKGKCVNLPNKPPDGYVPSDYNCQGNQECPCYVEKTECSPDDKCTDENGLMGKCGETAAGYGKSSINCNQDPNCPCHLPCKSEECEKNGGKCVLMSAKDVVIPVGFKESKIWCSEKIRCNCFMPNCPRTSSCRKAGGHCFSKKPTGGIGLSKGKCKRPCKCYKVLPIEIIQPAVGISKPIG